MGLSTHPRDVKHPAKRSHKHKRGNAPSAAKRKHKTHAHALPDPILTLCCDWPMRLCYGLFTLYQGALLVLASDIAPAPIAVLFVVGLLMAVDGGLAMLRRCARIHCVKLFPSMRMFQRWRHLLYLPPVFCYLAVLVWLLDSAGGLSWYMAAYYLTLAALGMALCVRDGLISQKSAHAIDAKEPSHAH